MSCHVPYSVKYLVLSLLLICHMLTAKEPATRVYKKVGERELRVSILQPQDGQAADQRPAIVFFHGGGWVSGAPTQFTQHCERLSQRGMVCIQVEYRLIPKGHKGPPVECIADAKSAMRWVRAHAEELGIDPARIGAGGGSAGGHLAAFVGMVEGLDDPQDDLSISPKANALVLFNPVFDNGPDQGWGHERVGARYREFSPAHQISADDPPAIVFLGTEDKLIPVSVVERFESGMKAVGVLCMTKFYPGQGHGFFNPGKGGKIEFYHDTLMETEKFLTRLGWLSDSPATKAP